MRLKDIIPEFIYDDDLNDFTGEEQVSIDICRTSEHPDVNEETVSHFMIILTILPPVMAWESLDEEMINGKHRLTAAHRLGWEYFPCVYVREK